MSKTLQNLPFVRLLIPFLLGIAFQYNFNSNYLYSIVGFFIALLMLLLSFIPLIRKSYSFRWFFGISVCCMLFFGACILTFTQLLKSEWVIPDGSFSYRVKLIEDPVLKPLSLMCKVYIPDIDKKVVVYLRGGLYEELHAGDKLLIIAHFRKFESSAINNTFDYAAYMKRQNYAAFAYISNNHWKKEDASTYIFTDLKSQALICRRHLLAELRKIMPEVKTYSVAAALVLGYMDALNQDLRMTFSSTGASHILVVSGMHMSVLYGALYFLLSFMNRSKYAKYTRQVVILLVIWFFAFLTGLSTSVVRAAIMISFLGMAGMLGQRSFTLNTVGASGLLMLIYNPLYLFDISFQLSFSAVISIVVVNPYFSRVYAFRNPIIKYMWDLVCVSSSAQIGTAPLTIYYFHQFPNLFLLTNLFVIPLSGILLVSLFASLILQSIFSLPEFIFKPVIWLVDFFIYGVELIEQIPFAMTADIPLDGFGVLFFYLLLIFFGLLLIHKKIVYFYLLISLVAFGVIYYL